MGFIFDMIIYYGYLKSVHLVFYLCTFGFFDYILGEGKAAANCKILNPEVLRFEEKNGALRVKAIDLLHIENDYLGYTIRFWLEELSIKVDGS
ncbi:MAG: hypothetical protein QM487_15340, partial [Candidatus Marithrix sp.]